MMKKSTFGAVLAFFFAAAGALTAAALYLSEGTVKQYINQLYAKLDMGGDPRTRRARLAEWYQKNAPRN